jgi:hypothetical protein
MKHFFKIKTGQKTLTCSFRHVAQNCVIKKHLLISLFHNHINSKIVILPEKIAKPAMIPVSPSKTAMKILDLVRI